MGRLLPPSRLDLAVALALTALGVVEGVGQDAGPGWYGVVVALALPLAWRRRHPWPVISWTLAILLSASLAGGGDVDTVLPLPLMVVLAFTAGREAADGRLAVLWAFIIGGALVTNAALSDGANSVAQDLVALVVIVGGATLAGHLVRVRSAENLRLARLTAQLEAEQDARARAAVLEERARVARELHDIVAHSVSLIAVQAAAADELLGRDEERARAALRAVQDTARGALGEMRRLLSVLRTDEPAPGLEPQPGLGGVADLVDQARAAGVPVQLEQVGEPVDVGSGLGLTAYRIVQEALTNVRKHAGAASTTVRIEHAPDEVRLEVANQHAAGAGDASPAADGHGLVGMRERVRIYGGAIEAGRDGERYVVRARLPIARGDA